MLKKAPPPAEFNAENIAKALERSDDFGHEMRVRAVLAREGAQVEHGWTYLDPVEKKPRQFDLRATLWHHELSCVMKLAVECKNLSAELPLVISGTVRAKSEAFHHIVYASPEANGKHSEVKVVDFHDGIYPEGSFVGKCPLRVKRSVGVLAVSSTDESDIYTRWTQALASADELCKRAMTTSGRRGGGQSALTAVLPCVVVPDGTLWTAHYRLDGSASLPQPSESTTLFLNHEVVIIPANVWMRLSHVHFFTLGGLRKFLAELTNPENDWSGWFPNACPPYRPPIH